MHIEGVEEMKPVAWRNLCVSNIGEDSEWIYNEIGQGEPLYTAPREWQYLTDDEIKEIVGSYGNGIGGYTRELFDKIEAKIKEKNV